MSKTKSVLRFNVFSLAFLAASSLHAQQSPPSASSAASANQSLMDSSQQDQLEEVTVTVQRRAERLQDVPITVSEVSAAKLADDGVTDITLIKVEVPGANVRDSAGYSQPYIRGVGSSAKTPLDEPPVATYVDDVYYGTEVNILTFNNIDDIQVIKGPQGTLFGRNTTGGLFNITTVDPSSQPTGTFHIGYGNYNSRSGDGYISGGISDNLAADLSVVGSTQGRGFGTNLTTGEDVYKNDHNVALRSKVLYTPDSATRVVFITDYDDQRNSLSSPNTFYPGSQLSPGVPVPVISSNPYDVENNVQPVNQSQSGGASLEMSHDFDSEIRIKSITAQRLTDYNLSLDVDGTAAAIFGLGQVTHDGQFTQEFQAQSIDHGRFSWTTGVFYYNGRARDREVLNFGALETYVQDFHANSVAGYAQGTYAMTPATNLTLGARYTYEDRNIAGDVTDTAISGSTRTIAPYQTHSVTEDKPSFRASVDQKITTDLMIYASFNSSFKSGGFSYVNVAPFLPETLTAYEVGLKSELFERRVALDVSSFYYDYRDIQVQLLTPSGSLVTNGAGAHIYGFDADLHAKLTNSFSLTSGLELLHAAYTSFDDAPIGTPLGGGGVVAGSAAGKYLPYAPHVTANVGLVQKTPLAGGMLTSSVVTYSSGKYYAQPDNFEFQRGYGSLNASVVWDSPSGMSVKFWGNNLADKIVMANAYDSAPTGRQLITYEPPRTYGVTLGYHF